MLANKTDRIGQTHPPPELGECRTTERHDQVHRHKCIALLWHETTASNRHLVAGCEAASFNLSLSLLSVGYCALASSVPSSAL